MEATGRLAVVTGASGDGIGLEIVRGIAQQGCDGVKVLLTARNINRGEEAVRLLNEEGLSNVVFHQLDITDPASIKEFVEWIRDNSGGLDILVNNAGIYDDIVTSAAIETNYFGTKTVTEALLGFMKTGARIINVSSSSGRLDILADETWKRKLLDSESLTETLVEQFVQEYLDKLSAGRGDEMISSDMRMGAYYISKMALNAYSQVLAKRVQEKGIIVTCMCPGHTSTKMSMRTGHPATLGADTAVWLATAPAADISTGKFYVSRKCVESRLEIPCVSGETVYHSLDDWMGLVQKLGGITKDISA